MMTWGHVYWPYYLIAFAVLFLAPEIYALVSNSANTLSAYIWQLLHVPTRGQHWSHTAAWVLTQGMFAVTAYWLWRHIWWHEYL